MRSSVRMPALLALLGVTLWSSVALAEGGHGFVWNEHGFYIIDFFVVLFALVWFVRKPLNKYLEARRDNLEREIDEAKKLQDEARATVAEYARRLENLDAELEKIRAQAKQDGEALRARIIADGKAQAEKLVADAEARVKQESAVLSARLEREIVEAALERASEMVGKGLTPMKHRDFMRDYVTQIEQLAAEDGGTLRNSLGN